MNQRIWRQRRRIFLVAVLALSAAFLLLPGKAHLAVVLLAVLQIPIVFAAVVFRPQLRFWLTKCAIAGFTFSVLNLISDADFMPLLMLICLGLAVLLVPSQLWVLDVLRMPGISINRARRRIGWDREALWGQLFPTATEDHWDPAVAGINPTPSPDIFTYMYANAAYHGNEHVPIRVFDVARAAEFKLRDLSLPDVEDGGPVSVLGHQLDEMDGDTVLTLTEGTWRQGIWTAFNSWLDDYLEDHMDRITALLHNEFDWSVKGQDLRRFIDEE
ncbi:MAG: hypothetical protein AAF439_09365 [Pseudomonadota bacterium]